MEDFQYVVQRKEQERICFLSGKERYYPREPDKLFKYYNLDITSALYKTLNKVRSNKGAGGLSNLAPRFPKLRIEQIPDPVKYNIQPKRDMTPSYVPFGISAAMGTRISTTPGPGAYPVARKCRQTRMRHRFGGRVKMVPAVETLCIPRPTDTCVMCKQLCVGDYWHWYYSTFLCLKCMLLEKKQFSKFSRAELQEFKRMRNCSFTHQHDGTTAAIQLVPKKLVCKKFQKENYFDLFFNKYY